MILLFAVGSCIGVLHSATSMRIDNQRVAKVSFLRYSSVRTACVNAQMSY
jgi:hypothetical protein